MTEAGIQLRGPRVEEAPAILSEPALAFVADLTRAFRPRRNELLERRVARQARFDAGERPRFLTDTARIRADRWTVAPIPDDLQKRRVEITGPVDRKMVINALNSGADVFMADFEDANAPTWLNCVRGQQNLMDANGRTISFDGGGKTYCLNDQVAVLMVRPRGLHLDEQHVWVDGEAVPGSLFDFGMYLFHNHRLLAERGSGPYFYLPKLESHLEARWWNDVFVHAQSALGIPAGTIRATVLIETIPAAFEMDEILWELKDHSAGLNCGRWDYIFSYIKVVRNDPNALLPDRSQVGMTQPFMRAYSQRVIQVCHRRGVHAIGGMAAQIPIKTDSAANEAALEKVRQDKEREANDGHDGTWVAHPALVSIARDIFDRKLEDKPNQIDVKREDVNVTEADLLELPTGTRTEAGLRQNVNVGIQYIEAWLGGQGCVPLFHLMEDAATAEISRTQVWQWVRHGAHLDDGRTVDEALVRTVTSEEMERIREAVGPDRFEQGRYERARDLFLQLATASTCESFLTLPAYEQLLARE
ncbi:MAG TPA: malate synthase A [Myxococcales bacterium LLY-WYZ-16_1]|nr:malate synthase A [Myxococcales bacterium LLY-WYZ-16_1]